MREFDKLREAHSHALHAAFLAGLAVGIITGAALVLLTILGVGP